MGLLMQMMRAFDQRQSQLFLMVCTFLKKYPSPELQPLVDDDVAEAMAALASTYETAARGLIYEHRPASLPAERIVTTLRPVLAKAGEGGGSSFERDVAVVLRRAEEAVRDVRAADPGNRRAFIDFLVRVVVRHPPGEEAEMPGEPAAEPSRLIIP